MVVLVIGGTGTVGTLSVRALLAAGAKVRVLAQNPQKAKELFPKDVEIVVGSYDIISKHLQGVDKVLLITPSSEQQPEIEGKIASTVQAARIAQLVKISTYGASPAEPSTSFHYLHFQAEQNIIKSGVPYTILRPNFFAQNFVRDYKTSITLHDSFYAPINDRGRVSVIDVRDVADVAAKVLTTPGHENATYELTGPEDFTWPELAAKFTTILGREIKFQQISDAKFHEILVDLKVPNFTAVGLIQLFQYYRKDRGSGVVGNTEIILGREARKVDDYIKEAAPHYSPLSNKI